MRVTVEHVLYADRHGVDSHGCGMLKAYDVGLRAGWLTATPTIETVRETDATALLDGGAGIGHAAADAAMRLAIEKALATGVAGVAVRNSGHFGAAGSYARLASDAGLIGLATTNTREPAVVPAFGADAMLGTNPIALAAPAARNPPFLLDMATSTAALGKLVVAWRKGRRIPRGWAVDSRGRPVRNGRAAALGRRLTPLGATPQMGSHKGYGLATAVEILSAVLPGDGVGHFFLALDPARFRAAGEFEAGVDALLDALRASRPLDAVHAGPRCGRSRAHDRGAARSDRDPAGARRRRGSASGRARSRCRLGARRVIARKLYGNALIAVMLRGQRALPFAPREEVEAARDRRVRRIVAFAAEQVPFYRDWFAREGADPREFTTAPDLERLPLLDRDEVRAEPHRFMAAGHSALRVLTSGSTGAPLEVHHDHRSLLGNIAWGERERQPLIEACGTFRPKEIYVGNETSVMKDVTAFYAANTRLPMRPRRRFVSVREQAQTLAEIVNRERPDILVGYGGWIHLFFQTVAARGIALQPPKLVMYMAEALPPGGRELIEGTFGVPVMSRYSAAEAFKVGFYCEHRTGFHLHEDLSHVRVLESGRLVISNLVNRGSVLLNYPIGIWAPSPLSRVPAAGPSGCSPNSRAVSRTSWRWRMGGSCTRAPSGRSFGSFPTCCSTGSYKRNGSASRWSLRRSTSLPTSARDSAQSRSSGGYSPRRRRSRSAAAPSCAAKATESSARSRRACRAASGSPPLREERQRVGRRPQRLDAWAAAIGRQELRHADPILPREDRVQHVGVEVEPDARPVVRARSRRPPQHMVRPRQRAVVEARAPEQTAVDH